MSAPLCRSIALAGGGRQLGDARGHAAEPFFQALAERLDGAHGSGGIGEAELAKLVSDLGTAFGVGLGEMLDGLGEFFDGLGGGKSGHGVWMVWVRLLHGEKRVPAVVAGQTGKGDWALATAQGLFVLGAADLRQALTMK